MGVDAKHPQYEARSQQWDKCRAVAEGEETVKAAGTKYLPRLDGMDTTQFFAYRDRASFFGATGRTVAGLSGAVLRKPPELIAWPESQRDILNTLGPNGEPMEGMLAETVEEVLRVGRVGLLVDAPEGEGKDPYVSVYFAENITNWRTEVGPDGRLRLTMVVLAETVDDWDGGESEFEPETIKQFRVLWLTKKEAGDSVSEEEAKEPYYHQDLWQENKDAKGDENKYLLTSSITPRMSGGRLHREIPFVIVNAENLSADVSRPPLLDLANVNLAHYRNSADLEHGLHFTALPTPWVAGFDIKGTLKIGSGVAWVSKETDAQAGMLEFSGAGLGSIVTAMDKKEQQMASIGGRLLEQQKKAVEAADTVRMRHAGESSVLARIAATVSRGVTKALRWVYLWTRPETATANELALVLNDDYNLIGLAPQELEKLMAALQSGLISWDTWIYNLQRGELLPDGVTEEQEAELIRSQGLPSGMGLPVDPKGIDKDVDPEDDPEDDEDPEDEEK